MLRLAFDYITGEETRTRPNAYSDSKHSASCLSFLPLWLHYNLNPLCVQY